MPVVWQRDDVNSTALSEANVFRGIRSRYPWTRSVRIALISDIHGNLEALEAVFADIAASCIDEVVCLGDTAAFGPNPCECLDRLMKCDLCLLGDMDQAILQPSFDGVEGGCELDWARLDWAREQLLRGEKSLADPRREFLRGLAPSANIEGFQFVHGSISEPLSGYVFPEDVYNSRKMEKLFSLIERHSFQGHTHLPGVFTQSLDYFSPEEIDYEFHFGDEKTMINVGSVGQPRDGDPRACYVTVMDATVRFHRVDYDFERTVAKLAALP